MNLKIRTLSYPLGAEVIGVDLTKPIPDATFREIHHAFLEHCGVLLFRGQSFTREQFMTFSRLFGELGTGIGTEYPEHPGLSYMINEPRTDGSPIDTHFNGSDWHSDGSMRIAPMSISLLHAIEVPAVGGDTQFANMYLAYETLSDGMKKLLERLEGVHMQEERFLDHSTPERLEASRRAKTIAHPLIIVHPETGRKSLFVSDKVTLIAGMTPEESRPLLDFLCGHARRPQLLYRHTWQKDDLLMWDNRCTNHNALGNYDRRNQRRHMEKTFIWGQVTGYLYHDETQARNVTRGALVF